MFQRKSVFASINLDKAGQSEWLILSLLLSCRDLCVGNDNIRLRQWPCVWQGRKSRLLPVCKTEQFLHFIQNNIQLFNNKFIVLSTFLILLSFEGKWSLTKYHIKSSFGFKSMKIMWTSPLCLMLSFWFHKGQTLTFICWDIFNIPEIVKDEQGHFLSNLATIPSF